MNETPIRRFCESPHRKAIVAIVTTVFGLLVLIPLADDYFDKKESRITLTEELGHAREVSKGLPELEEQVDKVEKQLLGIESRAITEDSISRYRSKLVDLVREQGCQVRRIDVSQPTSRPWFEGDNPLLTQLGKASSRKKKTPFVLQRRSVKLLVDGSMEEIRGFLEQLQKDDAFAYPQLLEFHATSGSGDSVTLELELWLFALGRQKA